MQGGEFGLQAIYLAREKSVGSPVLVCSRRLLAGQEMELHLASSPAGGFGVCVCRERCAWWRGSALPASTASVAGWGEAEGGVFG